MLIDAGRGIHLAYCTNIHAAAGWSEVFANIKQHAPALKRRLSPDAPFAIGLRLSAQEAEQLLWGNRLAEFARFLHEEGLYVFTINGFPYGSFHRSHIKAAAFAPDWQSAARVDYTLRLAEILAALLPPAGEGGISTAPLSYKPWIAYADFDAWQQLTTNIVRVCGKLVRLRAHTGKLVHIDLEPAPDGLLETGAETVAFYNNWLLPLGIPALAQLLGVSLREARAVLLDHVRVCVDTCHLAVAYENLHTLLANFTQAGIKIGKLQLSAALKLTPPQTAPQRATLAQSLLPFAESTYLHQVIERCGDGSLRHYRDLNDGLRSLTQPETGAACACEWRTHFHVPIYMDRVDDIASTQDDTQAALALLYREAFTHHVEIDTYTWAVLPQPLKQNVLDSLEREYRWVHRAFAPQTSGASTDLSPATQHVAQAPAGP